AFKNVKTDTDPVARQGGNDGVDLDTILALGQVLLLELELGALEHCLVEHTARTKPHGSKRLIERFGIEFAHAIERDRGNGGTFFDIDDQDVVVGIDADVAKEPCGIQPMNRIAGLLFGTLLTNLDRQVTEHGPRIYTLDSVYTNILHDEGREGARQGWRQAGRQDQRQDTTAIFCFPTKRHPGGSLVDQIGERL